MYDDKLLLTYNYSDGTQALTLKEIEHRKKKRWAASVSDYRCCPLKLCFYPLSDRMKESNFLILFVGCALLRLFKILAGRVHIGFHFPKLLRIPPDGFELGMGFGMLLFQSGIRNFRNEKSWIPVAL